MKKRLLLTLLITVIMASFVGCNKETKNDKKLENKNIQIESVPQDSNVGKWNFNYTKEEVDNLNEEILNRVEEKTKSYGLEYELSDIIGTDKERPVVEKSIYTDNENPDPNRLESMYYGYKVYEENLSSGQIVMKIGFNLDKELIKEQGEFKFEDTSIGEYSKAFTNDDNRDYNELNQKIYSIISGETTDITIENNLEGLKETIMITDNYLLYILETKEYDFTAK